MKYLPSMVLAEFLALYLTGTSAGMVLDRVVAIVDHDPITLSELKKESVGGDDRKALEKLIERKLVEKEAQKLGITVLESEIDEALQNVKRRNDFSDEDLKKNLKAQGTSLDAYRQQVREQIERAKIINKELRNRITISDEEMRDYYQKKKALFFRSEEVRIQHVFLKLSPGASAKGKKDVRTKAENILRKVRAGSDFSRLAKMYSEDLSTASNGGDLGFVGKGELQADFGKAAFSFKPGGSGLIETHYGIHVIKVLEKRPARPVPFEEVEGQVRDALIQEKAETIFHDWIEELKEKAVIEVKL